MMKQTILPRELVLIYSPIKELDTPGTHLSAAETSQWNRFGCERKRREFVVTRQLAKHILALYFNCDASAIILGYEISGRPIIDQPRSDLQISWSHHRDHVVFGLYRSGRIGVDLEHCDREVDHMSLAKRFCPPSFYQRLKRLSPPEAAKSFFHHWCQKESEHKVIGGHFLKRLNDTLDEPNAVQSVSVEKDGFILAASYLVKPTVMNFYRMSDDFNIVSW